MDLMLEELLLPKGPVFPMAAFQRRRAGLRLISVFMAHLNYGIRFALKLPTATADPPAQDLWEAAKPDPWPAFLARRSDSQSRRLWENKQPASEQSPTFP